MKNKIVASIAIALMLYLANSVYATKIDIETQNKELKLGDTITFNINVSEIDLEDGINIIQGKLEYDKDVFEEVNNQDFTSENNWSIVYNDENTDANGKFILLNLASGKKEDEQIAKVKFKVKDDIKSTNSTIKLVELCTVNDDNIVDIQDSGVKLKIKGKFSISNMFENLFENIRNIFVKK